MGQSARGRFVPRITVSEVAGSPILALSASISLSSAIRVWTSSSQRCFASSSCAYDRIVNYISTALTLTTHRQVAHRLVHEQLFQSPLLNVPRLIVLQLVDILHGSGQHRAFRLFTTSGVRNDGRKLVDTLVDVSSPTALYLFLDVSSIT